MSYEDNKGVEQEVKTEVRAKSGVSIPPKLDTRAMARTFAVAIVGIVLVLGTLYVIYHYVF